MINEIPREESEIKPDDFTSSLRGLTTHNVGLVEIDLLLNRSELRRKLHIVELNQKLNFQQNKKHRVYNPAFAPKKFVKYE